MTKRGERAEKARFAVATLRGMVRRGKGRGVVATARRSPTRHSPQQPGSTVDGAHPTVTGYPRLREALALP